MAKESLGKRSGTKSKVPEVTPKTGQRRSLARYQYLNTGQLLEHTETEKIKFERIHRIRKPAEMPGEIPRDVIARFHNYKDKE